MITHFNEHDSAMEIDIYPETKEEVAMLFRFINNAKSEKPSLNLSFRSDRIVANIFMRKIKVSMQKNSVSK